MLRGIPTQARFCDAASSLPPGVRGKLRRFCEPWLHAILRRRTPARAQSRGADSAKARPDSMAEERGLPVEADWSNDRRGARAPSREARSALTLALTG